MWRRTRFPAIVIVLVAGVAYFVYKIAKSDEWLEFRSDRFWHGLSQLHLAYLLLATLCIFCSYFFRSVRWREFVAPMKRASLFNLFSSTLIGFSAVALLGRPAEVVRPLLIARKEQLPVSSQFGAWTLERIFDALTMGLIMGVSLVLFPPLSSSGDWGARIAVHLRTAGVVFCAGAIATAALLSQFRRHAPMLTGIVVWFARALPERYRARVQSALAGILASFADGLASIETLRRFAICMALSVLVWIPIVGTYWAVIRAFGSPMNSLTLGAVILLLAVSMVGSIAQLPAVGGGPQVAAVLVLTQLFGIPPGIATSAAMLLWVLCFMAVLLPGVLLAAREGLSWSRLRSMVKGSGAEQSERMATLDRKPRLPAIR